MKRALITTFAVFYTVALMLGACDRTAAWVAQKASAAEEKGSGPIVSEGKDSTPHHPNRRIVPGLFVVEPPAADSGISLVSSRHGLNFQSSTVRPATFSTVPSRAPPQA